MKKARKRKNQISAKTTIIAIVVICVVCLAGIILLSKNNKTIDSDEAFAIVLEDLGMTESEVGTPHVHEDTYENQSCYNIYVTVNGESLTYVVSTKGEILHKGEGSHSH